MGNSNRGPRPAIYNMYIVTVDCSVSEVADLDWHSTITDPGERWCRPLTWDDGKATVAMGLKCSVAPSQYKRSLSPGELPYNADHGDITKLLSQILKRPVTHAPPVLVPRLQAVKARKVTEEEMQLFRSRLESRIKMG